MVLSNQRQDMSAAAGHGRARQEDCSPPNPLVQDNKQLMPSVTRVFKKDQEMFVYLEAYQPDAQTTQPLVATVSFYRGKVKAFETAPLADHRRTERQVQGAADDASACRSASCSRAGTPARSACSIRKPRSSPSGARPSSWCSNLIRAATGGSGSTPRPESATQNQTAPA